MSIERARRLRKALTPWEVRLWSHLRRWRSEGLHLRRQASIGPYVADFICHAAKTVIELDGGGHADPVQSAHDRERDAWFADEGYLTLRIWNRELEDDFEAVLERLWAKLHERKRLFGKD